MYICIYTYYMYIFVLNACHEETKTNPLTSLCRVRGQHFVAPPCATGSIPGLGRRAVGPSVFDLWICGVSGGKEMLQYTRNEYNIQGNSSIYLYIYIYISVYIYIYIYMYICIYVCNEMLASS